MATAAGTRRGIALVLALASTSLVAGGVVWFDPDDGSGRPAEFAALVGAYRSFLGQPDGVIGFDGLPVGGAVSSEYAASDGVTFRNTSGGPYGGYSGVQLEAGAIAEHITGYDGSYRPDGDRVYVRFSNDLNPFTIEFADPVAVVGAFVGMGVQGSVHSLTVRAFDRDGALLGAQVFSSWLWEASPLGQNYERFVALRSPLADIARLELQNDATTDFANALIIDDIAYGRSIPEPGTLLLTIAGALLASRRVVRAASTAPRSGAVEACSGHPDGFGDPAPRCGALASGGHL